MCSIKVVHRNIFPQIEPSFLCQNGDFQYFFVNTIKVASH